MYTISRDELCNNVFSICNSNIVNTRVLLWGDSSLTYNDEEHLLGLVHMYIKKPNRLNIN